MNRLLALFLVVLSSSSSPRLDAQDWQEQMRSFYFTHRFTDRMRGLNDLSDAIEIDAPRGYLLVDRPDPGATVLRTIDVPSRIRARHYFESGTVRFYLTEEAASRFYETQQSPTWVVIPGTGRAAFIEGTTSARMLKKERREDPKLGPVNAEVYAETVPLMAETTWGDGYRMAEIDFAFPAKVVSFVSKPEGSWEATFTLFPAFNSDTERIPGPRPEFYDDPYRALISTPDLREVKLRGSLRADELKALLVPHSVWAAGFSEGRLQHLRIGYSWLPPEIECSPLSHPAIRHGDRMSFRFLAARLNETPVTIETTPDRILGVDYTDYGDLARLRPYEAPEGEPPLPEEWNVTLSPREGITVIAPLMEGRGAAGMLELESLGLDDSYETDLKALRAFWKVPAPEFGRDPAAPWVRFADEPMGMIPSSQQGR